MVAILKAALQAHEVARVQARVKRAQVSIWVSVIVVCVYEE
jgi:hypothetical protein